MAIMSTSYPDIQIELPVAWWPEPSSPMMDYLLRAVGASIAHRCDILFATEALESATPPSEKSEAKPHPE